MHDEEEKVHRSSSLTTSKMTIVKKVDHHLIPLHNEMKTLGTSEARGVMESTSE